MEHKIPTPTFKPSRPRYTSTEETTDSTTSYSLTHYEGSRCNGWPPYHLAHYEATSFTSQFAANKTKQLEVANLFNIKQNKGEALKSYLARFNNATVRVNDPDQKFFIKAFQKGLRAGQFSDSLALRRPQSMEEIRAQAEKHIEVEEDQADRVEAERQLGTSDARSAQKGENKYQSKHKEYPQTLTPLREKRAQILRKIYHTNLLKYPKETKGR
ncbi:hypothetical protein CR513_10568, partial [Mucuna pruriens]